MSKSPPFQFPLSPKASSRSSLQHFTRPFHHLYTQATSTMAKYWEEHPHHIWLYNPSFALAAIAAVFYFIPAVIQLYQMLIKYKSYYFVALFLGAILEVVGYAVRTVSSKNSTSIVSLTFSSSPQTRQHSTKIRAHKTRRHTHSKQSS